jgi:hypothetical protein
MKKSATEIMQEAVYAAVIDSIVALKGASKGLPNNLLRDLNAIHANTTYADLPPELQASIGASVRAIFARLLKEGYSVSGGEPAPARHAPPPRDGAREQRPHRSGPRRDGPGGPPRRDGPGGGPGPGRPSGPGRPRGDGAPGRKGPPRKPD